jgi:pyruvate dehydrogenase E1 component alpha subunit
MGRDPIPRYKHWLLSKGLATEAELATIESEAQAAVDASVEFARQGKDPDPEQGVLHTHAEGAVLASQFYNRKGPLTT